MGGAPSRILEKLWLGGADVLDDFEAFAREKGIDAVVSLGEETVRAGIPKLHLDEQDTPETDLRRHFNAIVNFIHDHRCRGLGVYVHCHAGVSRSGAAAAAYLVAWLDLGVRDALGHLMRCRDTVLPNPGFRDQLLDFADDPATGSLRDQLRRTRGPLLAEDLTDVARELEASRDRVETTRKSEWLYEFSGKPVPEDAEIERDDYGLFVREDGSRCSVARAGAFLAEAEHDWSRSDAAPLDVLDYEGQISRLQAKLAPALRSKRPTPKSGLGWLARPEEKEAWAEPGDAGGDARRGDDAKGWASDAPRTASDADAELAAALRTAPAAITAAFADDVVDLTSEPDAPAPAPAPAGRRRRRDDDDASARAIAEMRARDEEQARVAAERQAKRDAELARVAAERRAEEARLASEREAKEAEPEAWKPFLRPFVAKIEPYRVDQPIETREALAASMRYLGDLAADMLPQLRARGVVWPLPPRWTRSG
ncbi:phosphatase [Aureococcus anophagefferens]|nr:phosphatase [Aureococcus anophagefferens]